MSQYFYTAKSKEKEKKITGTIEASNEKELAQILRKDNLFLIEAKEKKSGNKKSGAPLFSSFFDRITLTDKIFFTKNLQVMLSGGLSLSRTLQVLSLQTKNKRFKSILFDIREEINKGKSFSVAMARHSDVFSEIFQSMIQLSEETGAIEENLSILTKQMEKEYELKSKIKGALIYPAVIISAMIGIGLLMLISVVPQLAQIFERMEVELPLTTQFIINFGNFLSSNWFFILIFIFGLFYFFKIISKTKKGKLITDSLLLKIPLVSSVIKKTNSAYMARTLSSLLLSGVSIIRGLEIISRNLSNIYFKKSILESIGIMKEGGKLSQALKSHTNLYSLLIIQMIEVGEETGQTSKVLSKTAEFFEEEVFNLTKNLTSVIEPILMIIIGAAIGFFAVSMLQPIYSIIGTL